MANNTNEDEIADFSGYLKPKENKKAEHTEAPSSFQELPSSVKFTKRTKVLLLLLLVLAAVQAALLLMNARSSTPQLPDGYRLVTPNDQPAYIEPIK